MKIWVIIEFLLILLITPRPNAIRNALINALPNIQQDALPNTPPNTLPNIQLDALPNALSNTLPNVLPNAVPNVLSKLHCRKIWKYVNISQINLISHSTEKIVNTAFNFQKQLT